MLRLFPLLCLLPLLAACPPEDDSDDWGFDAGTPMRRDASLGGDSSTARITCTVPGDCDDGHECTTDTCIGNECFHDLVGDRDGDGYASARIYGGPSAGICGGRAGSHTVNDICSDCDDSDSSKSVWQIECPSPIDGGISEGRVRIRCR
jgi:hypothetical protein